jgi:ketosteroid isomerase-like protein
MSVILVAHLKKYPIDEWRPQMKQLAFALAILAMIVSVLAAAFPQASKRSVPDPESAVRIADQAWEKAVAEKSIERTMEMYDAEAVTAGSAMFPANGIADFRANWTKFFAQPDFSLSWKTEKVLITKSGTIAYSSGTWASNAKPMGPYLAVWRKQSDGKWKLLIDAAWNPPGSK